jgi:drug/metabolite transporter (DMT)-like permease
MADAAAATGETPPWRGVLYLLAAVAVLPVMDGFAKALTTRYPVLEVAWARFFFAFLVLLPFVARQPGRELMRPPRLALQLLRSVCQVLAVSLFFLTLSHLPLADTLAICFLYPLITVALAGLLLGEAVGPRRWLAVLVGFLGAMIIIRPGLGVFQPAALMGLATSLVFAVFIILTRKLAGSAPPAVILIWGTLVGAVLTTALLPLVWVPPTVADLLAMLAVGGIGALGHLLLLKAYELAPASLLSPLGYAEIIGAALVGWVAFGDFPDAATWLGIAVISVSGSYIAMGAPPPRRIARYRSRRRLLTGD